MQIALEAFLMLTVPTKSSAASKALSTSCRQASGKPANM